MTNQGATTEGGIALDLPVGQFSPSYLFDATVVDTTVERGTIRLWEDLDRGENVLQKIIYTASSEILRGSGSTVDRYYDRH